MSDLLASFALLTILPVRRELQFSARALGYFPLVGALLGLILALSFLVFRSVFSPLISASLVVALWALLTGGLHLDGSSDACDALFAAVPPSRRLEILHDVHLGVFGAVGLFLTLLLKFSALTATNVSALLLAPMLARWAIVYAAAFPLARETGMAALFTGGLSRRDLTFGTLIAFVCALPFGWLGAASWVVTVVVATVIARFAIARLGGLTGDIYGMICECVEIGVLLTCVVMM